VDTADELRPEWIAGAKRVGVTAGASAPEILVTAVIEQLKRFGATNVEEVAGAVEKIVFPLPKGLAGTLSAKAPEVGPRS